MWVWIFGMASMSKCLLQCSPTFYWKLYRHVRSLSSELNNFFGLYMKSSSVSSKHVFNSIGFSELTSGSTDMLLGWLLFVNLSLGINVAYLFY